MNRVGWWSNFCELVSIDMLQFLRDWKVVVSTLMTPAAMVLAFGLGTNSTQVLPTVGTSYFQFIFAGILALGVMFSCSYAIGFSFIIDRRRRTIEDIVLSPVSYSTFIGARVAGMILKSSIQFLVSLILSVTCYGAQILHPLLLVFTFVTGASFFAGLGIIVSIYTNEISFSGVINMILIPLSYFSGVFFPMENMGSLGRVLRYLPLSNQVDMFRYSTTGMSGGNIYLTLILLLIYALVAMASAVALFRWEIEKQ